MPLVPLGICRASLHLAALLALLSVCQGITQHRPNHKLLEKQNKTKALTKKAGLHCI